MEDQNRAAPLAVAATSPTSTTPAPTSRGWIVSPVYDLLFLANLGWLLLFLPGIVSSSGTAVDFWQVYYLTLPHRWITLILVLTDRDRRGTSTAKFWWIGSGLAFLVLGVYVGTGAFLCLAVADYIWNAWHFASQHAGVLRMYTRKVGGGLPALERWGLRFLVTYGALRAAGWLTGWTESQPQSRELLAVLDGFTLLIPLALLVTNGIGWQWNRLGKMLYLLSVCSVYSGLILALQQNWSWLIVLLATAGSLMHAVEYLAIVTHYAWQRQHRGSAGPFRQMASVWLLFLLGYALVLGTAGAWLSESGSAWMTLWTGLNLWGAFVHYAYDGLIWKLRQPGTAATLGLPPTAGGLT